MLTVPEPAYINERLSPLNFRVFQKVVGQMCSAQSYDHYKKIRQTDNGFCTNQRVIR